MLNTDRREAEGLEVVFGDGTDGDTFHTVFQGLPVGYIVAINGVDYVVEEIDSVGISGFRYFDETDTQSDELTTVMWPGVHQLWIY